MSDGDARVSIEVDGRTIVTDAPVSGVRAALGDAAGGAKGPKLKADAEFDAAAEATLRKTADKLRDFVDAVNRLEEERSDLADEVKELMKRAKGEGFSPKALRRTAKILRMDSEQRAALRDLDASVAQYLGLVEGNG